MNTVSDAQIEAVKRQIAEWRKFSDDQERAAQSAANDGQDGEAHHHTETAIRYGEMVFGAIEACKLLGIKV